MRRSIVAVFAALLCSVLVTGCATRSATEDAAENVPKCAAGSPDVAPSNQRCLDAGHQDSRSAASDGAGHCICNGPGAAGASCLKNSDCDGICGALGGSCQ